MPVPRAGGQHQPHNFAKCQGLKVKPVKGKAILWANMRGDDWHESEPGSSHTALPVLRGIKWAATIWVHASGFRIPEQYAGRECSIRYAREQL